MKEKIILTNDFHNTRVTLLVEFQFIGGTKHCFLSAGQARKAQQALCGVAGCTCSNDLGTRGRQHHLEQVLYDCHPNYQGDQKKLHSYTLYWR